MKSQRQIKTYVNWLFNPHNPQQKQNTLTLNKQQTKKSEILQNKSDGRNIDLTKISYTAD